MISENSLLSKFVLTALLFSHKKVSGVRCFASGHVSSTLASLSNRNPDDWTRLNLISQHNDKDSGGSSILDSDVNLKSLRKKNLKMSRREMVSISSCSTLEEDDGSAVETELKREQTDKLIIRGGETEQVRAWPCGDALDRKLIKIALPCIANFAINPLVGAVDLFWINRMGNTLAVAGQAAANQIFSSAFWLTSFLPSVTATLVAKEYAKGSEEGVQDAVSQALIVGAIVALIGNALVLSRPDKLLTGVLKNGAPAREFARPYVLIRGFGFLPSLLSLIGFSSFRGGFLFVIVV